MTRAQPPLQIGDGIRPFQLADYKQEFFDLSRHVGRYIILFFYRVDDPQGCRGQICGFQAVHQRLHDLQATVVGVGLGPAESARALAEELAVDFPLLHDATGTLASVFGIALHEAAPQQTDMSSGRWAVLVDPNFRMARTYENLPPADYASRALEDVAAMVHLEAPRQLLQHAPVLLIPNVLPSEVCRELIGVWERQGNEESGFMRQVDGQTVGMVDYNHKIRRDHYLGRGELEEHLKQLVGMRVVPQIRKAFNYEVTRREDFRIACYDAARGGYFRPHRDNTTDGTAHRRFAMSLLLNDDYGGGYLRFPEYAPHHYRPQAGGAVVFSCSLLHEATDVTHGRRFVLLSFFYGEREARLREQYNQRTGGRYRA